MLYKEFYSELGKLLYAVADVDKVITQQEKTELQKIVRNELVPVEKHIDEFGTDAAYYSEMEFDITDDQILDSESAFNSFIDFVTEHHTAFDERMKKVSIHVVEEIATSYRGKNKKEKAIIKKLKNQLAKIEIIKNKIYFKDVGVDPLFSSEPIISDFQNTDVAESASNYGNLDDIIEEHQHKFDKRVKRMSNRLERNSVGSDISLK